MTLDAVTFPRRFPEGGIDFDFYRRRAARERQLALRHFIRRPLVALWRRARAGLTMAHLPEAMRPDRV